MIDPGGRTWRELLGVLHNGDNQEPGEPGKAGQFYFPFTKLPKKNWTSAPRSFGSRRSGGSRAHAGCDLYFPVGTPIHAITDGRVVRGPYLFYAGTYALEVDHGKFLARYGEVQANTSVRQGDTVKAGQQIAKVGRLQGLSVSMLHLELYSKKATGKLTVPTSRSAKTSRGVPFKRRKDLIDPTSKLNKWKNRLAGSEAAATTPVRVPTRRGIPTVGFCILLKRIRQETRASKGFARTIGEYQCYWNGDKIEGLSGQMVERGGPGDNTTRVGDNRDLRIEAGSYRLSVHHGTSYRTNGYKATGKPKPALLLEDTNERTYILIHPGSAYLSSVGCINPSNGLTSAKSNIKFADSRGRTIAIIDELKKRMGTKFPSSGVIPNAVIKIKGEPS